MRRTAIALSVLSALGGLGVAVRAQDATPEVASEAVASATDPQVETTGDEGVPEPARPTRRVVDLSRFEDGPRNVARPRGNALARAQKLGLGTRDTARRLMRNAPEARWTDAVRGRESRALVWPVQDGRFGRGYGFTRRNRPELLHAGIDVVAPASEPVLAVADGIVAYSDNGIRGFGNCVLIVHRNGWVSLYGHLARATVQPGWRVTRGERIGLVGQTGYAWGPHVHFELRERGRVIDPAPFFVDLPGRRRTDTRQARR